MNEASANVRAAVTRVAFAFLSSRTLNDAVHLNTRYSIPSLAKTRLTHEFGWAKSALRLGGLFADVVPHVPKICLAVSDALNSRLSSHKGTRPFCVRRLPLQRSHPSPIRCCVVNNTIQTSQLGPAPHPPAVLPASPRG